MRYIFLIFYALIFLLLLDFRSTDLSQLMSNRIIRKIYMNTYYGLVEPIRRCGYEYSIRKYICHALVFGGGVSLLFYATAADLRYALLVFVLVVVIIPYVYFMNIRSGYLAFIEESIFIYATNVVIYLREKKVVSEVLLLTSDSLEDPLKQDIIDLVLYINDTNNFNEALDRIEDKYRYSVLRNVHILLRNARDRGFNNENLYTYTFNSIEEYQVSLNNYRLRKKANRRLFYFMMTLDITGVLFLIKMFASSSFINIGSDGIDTVIFIFYLLNIITVLYYETYCLKINSIEKGFNL